MFNDPWAETQRRITCILCLFVGIGVLWFLSPGIPVWRAPRASAALKAEGQKLFEHEWEPHDPLSKGDGLGPVFNERSCVACHFQGGVGGGGDNSKNVTLFEVAPTIRHRELQSGLIHAFAVDHELRESQALVRKLNPVIKGGLRVVAGCQTLVEDFDPLKIETVNSTALFGAGWIDRIPTKAITTHHRTRAVGNIVKELDLDFSTIPAGRPRVLPDGRIGRFGWKAQFATLEEFVAAACANELGLSNPRMVQATPLVKSRTAESTEPTEPPSDLDAQQFRALTAFVDTLPRPVQILPTDPHQRARAENGKTVFMRIGCALCHTPDLGGVPGIYSDLLLHKVLDRNERASYGRIEHTPEVPMPTGHPEDLEWRTPPLWGVADSAPYFHDGRSPTLREAILRHAGTATNVTRAFRKLSADDQADVIAFLQTLKAPPDAAPAPASQPRRSTMMLATR